MNPVKSEPAIRRILVALDSTPSSMEAMRAAAELAASLGAELMGLFVEDIDLLRLAQLPFACQVGSFSATLYPLDKNHVERQLRAQAGRARQALAVVAERAQIRWSFRVARGRVITEVVAAATEVDLLILGKAGWATPGSRHLGATARAVLHQAPCLAMVLYQGACMGLPMIVVDDGSSRGEKALATAVQLVRERNNPLVVLVLADQAVVAAERQQQVVQWLREYRISAQVRSLVTRSGARLALALQEIGKGLLLLPAENPLVQEKEFQEFLEGTFCPVLVVR